MRKRRAHTDNYGKCPLCGSRTTLDFHHWTYRPERGIYLCRDCHSYIHEPKGARPSESSGDAWLIKATEQLIYRHREEVEKYPTLSEVMGRYDIPDDVSSIIEKSIERVIPEDERKRVYRQECMEEWAEVRESRNRESD